MAGNCASHRAGPRGLGESPRRESTRGHTALHNPAMAQATKVVLVTGGTGAIGGELVAGLLGAGAQVIVACRDAARGQALAARAGASAPALRVAPVDLASLRSVAELASWILGELPRLDGLVHAAGVWSRQRRLSADGLELTFAVNHLAGFALTTGLLPLLQRSRARVVTVASGLHVRGKLAWDDVMQERGGFNGVRAYEQSKLANVMFALALARRGGPALVSHALHPGIVRSSLTREYPELWKQPPPGVVPAAVAARAILRMVEDPALARSSGRYFDRDRPREPSPAARSVADQDRLWELSERLLRRAAG